MAKNVRVAALRTAGHCLTNEWEGLMAIQSAKLDDLAVQLEAVIGELRVTEADCPRYLIHLSRSAPECHIHLIKIGVFEIPQLDRSQVCQVNCEHGRISGRRPSRDILRSLGDYALPFTKNRLDVQCFSGCLQALHKAIDIENGLAGKNVLRLRENIFNKCRGHHAQRNFAINATEGQIVDLITKGRNIGPFARIQVNDKDILAVEIEVRCEIE